MAGDGTGGVQQVSEVIFLDAGLRRHDPSSEDLEDRETKAALRAHEAGRAVSAYSLSTYFKYLTVRRYGGT